MQAQKKSKYVWWERRLGRAFQLYDETRIDHFRGFAGDLSSCRRIGFEDETTASHRLLLGCRLLGGGSD